MQIGFLHIGKTGGNTLRSILKSGAETADVDLTWFPHDMTLNEALRQHPEMKLGFVFRDPVERFVSAFWSRLRMGRPRNNSMWSAEEAIAFQWFATPNDLAEALSGEDERLYSAAQFAMSAISHLRRNMAWTLGSPAALERIRDRLHFVCPLDQLDERLPALLRSLGMAGADSGQEHLHVRPEGRSQADEISGKGLAALRQYWKQDFNLYDYCLMHFGGAAGNALHEATAAAAEDALNLYRSGEHAKAVEQMERVLRVKPLDRSMLLIRARALSNLGDAKQSEQAWHAVLALEVGNPEALLSIARLRYKERDLEEAAALLTRAAAADPENSNIRRLQLTVAEAGGDVDLLAELIGLDDLTDEEIAASEHWRQAVNLHIHRGDLQRAEAICRARLTSAKNDANVRTALARVLYLQERLTELEGLVEETEVAFDSFVMTGLVRAALTRKDPDAAQRRLELLSKHTPASTSIAPLTSLVDAMRLEFDRRDPSLEVGIRVIALLGVSFCGSTALGSMLGSLPGVAHVGESHRLVKSIVRDGAGIANDQFDFENGDPAHLTPCLKCGQDCEVYSRDFRQELQRNPDSWYFKLARQAGVQRLVTGDKQLTMEVDPLERFQAVLLFKDPVAAFWSNLKRRLRDPANSHHFDDPVQYANTWARNYQRMLQIQPLGGETIHLHWDSFASAPEKHFQQLCNRLDLPYDATVLTSRDPDQHVFGGNRDVRDTIAAAPATFEVRAEEAGGVTDEQRTIIESHGQVQDVLSELMRRYGADFA